MILIKSMSELSTQDRALSRVSDIDEKGVQTGASFFELQKSLIKEIIENSHRRIILLPGIAKNFMDIEGRFQ